MHLLFFSQHFRMHPHQGCILSISSFLFSPPFGYKNISPILLDQGV